MYSLIKGHAFKRNMLFLCFPCFCFIQAADSKREEFRKYLEKAGVIDALTKGNI